MILLDGLQWTVMVRFDPRDMWIGIFWNSITTVWLIYICVVPMFPIQIRRWSREGSGT